MTIQRFDPETTSYPGSDAVGVTMSPEVYGDYISVQDLVTELQNTLLCNDGELRGRLTTLILNLEHT